MRIRKKETSVGFIGKVLNILNNSKQDAYSCDYINNLTIYSEEEVKTNKTWIDGKPIYRLVKVYTPTSSTATYSLDNLSIDTLIDIKHRIVREYNENTDFDNYYNNSTDYYRLFYRNQSKVLEYRSSITNGTVTVILEYTKTTDPVG